ncbi:hypothetical protein PM082_020176 [Marasmius tenuissimus]|nr:hypothetical protein PM082_020176 [Marasmius tenuissimus]
MSTTQQRPRADQYDLDLTSTLLQTYKADDNFKPSAGREAKLAKALNAVSYGSLYLNVGATFTTLLLIGKLGDMVRRSATRKGVRDPENGFYANIRSDLDLFGARIGNRGYFRVYYFYCRF